MIRALTVFFCIWAVQEAVGPLHAANRNVLLICIDDLRPVMGCYGGPAITPNIDRLAKSATVFTRHYVQWPVCGASRASMMSSLRPDSSKVYSNGGAFKIADRPETHPVLPLWFRNHGYTTLSFGKTFHGKSGVRYGWSRQPWFPECGWSCYVDFPIAYDHKWSWRPAYEIYEGEDSRHGDYQTATQAITALEDEKDGPFFIAVGFYKPHLPFVAPQKYWDQYEGRAVEIRNEEFPEGAAGYMYDYAELHSYGLDEGVMVSSSRPPTAEQARDMKRAYLAAVSFIDAQVGRILDRLDQLGLSRNTAVVLWGDHGFHLGDHARWAKHTQFENAMRSPLIARFPDPESAGGRITGRINSALVESIDIYPSLCDYSDIESPAHVEGASFVAIAQGIVENGKTAAYSQINPVGKRNRHLMAYSVRTDDFRYVEWRDTKDRYKNVSRELYDHRLDPHESRSVAGDSDYEAVLKEHAQLLPDGYPSLR